MCDTRKRSKSQSPIMASLPDSRHEASSRRHHAQATNSPYLHSEVCVRTHDSRRAGSSTLHESDQLSPAQEQKQHDRSRYPP